MVDKEEVVSRYAAMFVTNLACDPSNQVMSIRYILEFLSITTYVLPNATKVFILKLGGLPALIEAASLDGTESARYSGMALVNHESLVKRSKDINNAFAIFH